MAAVKFSAAAHLRHLKIKDAGSEADFTEKEYQR
ncbi:hypothetical protein EV130_101101 [Rhizobium azibense]|uniref:Uncharacterized protein n=1 Tax=Rhizobium azibense TaxID=1136135 RepID=A0A4R3R5X9_9HYPH|nr:hypothetical protein EV130_101101 [Rhizobium azibense]TCU41459.1 hypothetical protein EV129_101750 [Rhizobium azibense]